MKNSKKAESLVGIVVGIFLLAIVILGIGTLMGNSNNLKREFEIQTRLDTLSLNADNIIEKLDTSILGDNQVFYIYKNNSSKKYEIFIGEHNNEYKYIDKNGEKIDNVATYNGDIYTRVFYTKKIGDKLAIKAFIKKFN